MDILTAFLASPSGLVVKALLVASFVVFALGAAAAGRDGTFSWVYVDSYVRSTVMGRVIPVLIILLAGYAADEPTLTGAGILLGGTVATGMLASALESVRGIAHPDPDRNAVPLA